MGALFTQKPLLFPCIDLGTHPGGIVHETRIFARRLCGPHLRHGKVYTDLVRIGLYPIVIQLFETEVKRKIKTEPATVIELRTNLFPSSSNEPAMNDSIGDLWSVANVS